MLSATEDTREMQFCPKCGMRMNLVVKERGRSSKVVFKCPNCGYELKSKVSSRKSETLVSRLAERLTPKEAIVVIGEKEANLKTAPTQKVECPKCGNREAYVWMVQTRGADESSTQFFRCTKCGYTWREYS